MEVPSTNVFDLSHSNKLSFNMGDLVPVLNQEVYPGDKIQISLMHLLKMAPLVTPVMHRCKVDFHAFFVPNRLLWENFEKFQAYDTLNDIPVTIVYVLLLSCDYFYFHQAGITKQTMYSFVFHWCTISLLDSSVGLLSRTSTWFAVPYLFGSWSKGSRLVICC